MHNVDKAARKTMKDINYFAIWNAFHTWWYTGFTFGAASHQVTDAPQLSIRQWAHPLDITTATKAACW